MSTPSLKTEFKATPDQQDLAKLPRDLQFHPVRNDRPRVLSRDRFEQFNRDGYVNGLTAYGTDAMLLYCR